MNDKPKEYRANFGRAELEANLVEFEPTDKRIGPIKLSLRPLTGEQRGDFAKAQVESNRAKQVELLCQIIVDWNLENDNGKLPVDPATLDIWGDRLAHLRVELHPDIFTEDEIKATIDPEIKLICKRMADFKRVKHVTYLNEEMEKTSSKKIKRFKYKQ